MNDWSKEHPEILEDLFDDVAQSNEEIRLYMKSIGEYDYHIEIEGKRVNVIKD